MSNQSTKWSCPLCRDSVEWSYVQLAQEGEPICQHCDTGMVWGGLQPSGQLNPEGYQDCVKALLRFTNPNAECTCHDGGKGFQCDVCEGRTALDKAQKD